MQTSKKHAGDSMQNFFRVMKIKVHRICEENSFNPHESMKFPSSKISWKKIYDSKFPPIGKEASDLWLRAYFLKLQFDKRCIQFDFCKIILQTFDSFIGEI